MAEQTEPIQSDSAPPAAAVPTEAVAPAPSAPGAPAAAPVARRSVTLPLLPVAIVGGVLVALLFFGGGAAIGYVVASHNGFSGNAQQFRGGHSGDEFGNGTGFPRQNQGGQNGGGPKFRPGDRPTTAPNNG